VDEEFCSMKKMQLSKLFTCAIFITTSLITNFTLGQSEKCEIVGKVIEKNTGNTIIGAIITVPGTAYGAVSDVMGEYRMSLPSGNFTLDCRMVSFTPIQIKDVITNNKKQLQIDFLLEEQVQEGGILDIIEYRQTNTEAAERSQGHCQRNKQHSNCQRSRQRCVTSSKENPGCNHC
jgi:hypothetical protein